MRNLPRTPPAPLEGPRIEKHFRAMWQVLWNKSQLAADLSPTSTGDIREFLVREFLSLHLPGNLTVGRGHVLVDQDGKASPQMDAIVFRNSGFTLPMGNVSLVFPQDVLACVEVKSTLSKEDFCGQIANMFRALPAAEHDVPPPLKVVVATRLPPKANKRVILKEWAQEAGLEAKALPDIVIILANAAVVRSQSLWCLEGNGNFQGDDRTLFKFGHWQDQNWMGLMLLAFELAQRAAGKGGPNWSQYINQFISVAISDEL